MWALAPRPSYPAALRHCGIAALRADALLPLSAVLERLQRFSSLLSFSNLVFYLTSYTLGIPLSSFLLASSVCSCFGNSVCVWKMKEDGNMLFMLSPMTLAHACGWRYQRGNGLFPTSGSVTQGHSHFAHHLFIL